MAKKHILKQSALNPRGEKMAQEIKSWKTERYRRQKLRDEKKRRKEIANDFEIWRRNLLKSWNQTALHSIVLQNLKNGEKNGNNNN